MDNTQCRDGRVVVRSSSDAGSIYNEYAAAGHEVWAKLRPFVPADFTVFVRMPHHRVEGDKCEYLTSTELCARVTLKPSEVLVSELRDCGCGTATLGSVLFGNFWEWDRGVDSKDRFCVGRVVLKKRFSMKGLRTAKQKIRRWNNLVDSIRAEFEEKSSLLIAAVVDELTERCERWAADHRERYRKYVVHTAAHSFEPYEGGKEGLIERAGAKHLFDQLEALRAQAKGLKEAIRVKVAARAKYEWRGEEEPPPLDVVEAIEEALSKPEAFGRGGEGFHSYDLI
jgi:hypothetical protein